MLNMFFNVNNAGHGTMDSIPAWLNCGESAIMNTNKRAALLQQNRLKEVK